MMRVNSYFERAVFELTNIISKDRNLIYIWDIFLKSFFKIKIKPNERDGSARESMPYDYLEIFAEGYATSVTVPN